MNNLSFLDPRRRHEQNGAMGNFTDFYRCLAYSSQTRSKPRPWLALLGHYLAQALGVPNAGLGYIFYGYAKWIDNTLDEGELSEKEALAFLARQARIVLGDARPVGHFEEVGSFIRGYLRSAAGRPLAPYWFDLMQSFELDARRKNKFLPARLLDRRHRLLGTACVRIVSTLLAGSARPVRSMLGPLARLYIHTDTLLDLTADLEEGYVNIPRQILDACRIRCVQELNDRKEHVFRQHCFRAWMKKKLLGLREDHSRVWVQIPAFPSLPMRLSIRRFCRKKWSGIQRLEHQWAVARV